MKPIPLSRQLARRYVLARQGLWPARRFAGYDGTRAAMRAMEYVQLDPLRIVALTHDLLLFARVDGYEPAHFTRAVYEEREFFDWGTWLAVRPMEELPAWRVVMERYAATRWVHWYGDEPGDVIDEMRALLRERGPLSNRDIPAEGRRRLKSYRGGRDSAVALYYLWLTGEAMTHRRLGFERVYALAEQVAPPHLLRTLPGDEAERLIFRKQVAFLGPGRIVGLRGLFGRPVAQAEQRRLEHELVDAGEIVPVAVEGLSGRRFVVARDLPLLEALSEGRLPWPSPAAHGGVTLLSPLDPVVARGAAKELFDFDHTWEIYKRAEEVVFGRYTMPLLAGDRLVGRVDLKHGRAADALVVNGAWFEPGESASDHREALDAELERLRGFVGAGRVVFPQ